MECLTFENCGRSFERCWIGGEWKSFPLLVEFVSSPNIPLSFSDGELNTLLFKSATSIESKELLRYLSLNRLLEVTFEGGDKLGREVGVAG